LFAGTERAVHVSFDDGEHWQSLRLNMGATSIRDLIIKGDDLAVGTHGRGFWILDNITPLRQLQDSIVKSPAHLFKPQTTYRVRWNMNTDTPLTPDLPAGENPPDGAMIDFYLGSAISGVVTLEIRDAQGPDSAPLFECRSSPSRRSGAGHPALLGPAPAETGEPCRAAPFPSGTFILIRCLACRRSIPSPAVFKNTCAGPNLALGDAR
jgi:hypothetical protein